MYYLRRLLEHYELYALFIPIFIFYFIYIKQILCILYHYKIQKHVTTFYYPIDNESFLVNIFIIYPQRAAFDVFYINQKNNNLKIIKFILILSITLLLGIPFFIIKTIFLLIFTHSRSRTWNYLSKYNNKIILTVDGNIVTNMKNWLTGFIKENFAFTKNIENNIEKCLLKTSYGGDEKRYSYHGCAYNKDTHLGVIYTTKEQEFNIYIRHLNGTYVYAQQILHNDFTYHIENNEIEQLLNISGTLDVLRAHYEITKSHWIISNKNSRQSLIQINEKMHNDAKNLINRYGGIDKVKKALEFQDQYELVISNATKLLWDLENSSKIFRKTLLSNEAHIYKQLCNFKEISIDPSKTNILNQLIKNFDDIHNNL